MTTQTADEVRAEYIAVLGGAFGRYHFELRNEVAWLSLTWNEYLEIYGRGPEQLELLNRSAPGFFSRLQEQLFHAILLHLCRLTDVPEMAGRENLTVRQLPDLIAEPELAEKVSTAVEAVLTRTEFARHWRNRRIAHRDLETLRGGTSAALPAATKDLVDKALDALDQCLNEINRWHFDSETAFRHIDDPWGAGHLMFYVTKGVQAVDEEEKRLTEGRS